MTRFSSRLAFGTAVTSGLAAVAWVAIGYAGSNPLALAVTLVIGAFFLLGVVELQRLRQATQTLAQAADALAAPASAAPTFALGPWLETIHPTLRNAVRLRVEGERAALPGPALTPYLTGLLLLLGMLGTFVGLVVTLKGTGLALETATDLAAVRASLAAPVKGLGVAFGTSLAGVATSAMLGLLSALARRERLQAGQQLETRIGTRLRAHSPAHQRESSLRLLERQAELLPAVVDRLQAMMERLEQQHLSLHQQLLAGQDRFHQHAGTAYTDLAASVDRSLKDSLADSARQAGAAIQPAVEATLAGLAREAAVLHSGVAERLQQQLDAMAQRFEASTAAVAGHWRDALAQQRQANTALAASLGQQMDGFSSRFAERSDALVDGVTARLGSTAEQFGHQWQAVLAGHAAAGQAVSEQAHNAMAASAERFDQRAAGVLQALQQAQAEQQAQAAERDQQRLAAWREGLAAMAGALRDEWRAAGAETARQQQQVSATLAETAQAVSTQAAAQAQQTIAEIGRLVEAAAAAPRAAAEVIDELRDKLTDSMARDNAMLDERACVLATLTTLLDAVNHASSEQRTAIDQLVGGATALMERTAAGFAERVAEDGERLAEAAAQLGAGAAEVASLGEAFGQGVQLFSQSSETLTGHLQTLDATLAQAIARSDEQLAYYVAQARELIDLSLMSQQRVVDDLQRLAQARGAEPHAAGTPADEATAEAGTA